MVRVRYVGVMDAKARFEAMRPAVDELTQMMKAYKPFGPDWLILDAARTALATAAFHFTREPYMFGSPPT